MKKTINIAAASSIILDAIVILEKLKPAKDFINQPEIQAKLSKGDKLILSQRQYAEFNKLAAGKIEVADIGGSAFNTLSTLALADQKINVTMLTNLAPPHETNIKILPLAESKLTSADYSYICIDGNGDKIILKHPNREDGELKIGPDFTAELKKIISQADMFFLSAGITRKFPARLCNLILAEIIKRNIPLIFALPTHSELNDLEGAFYKKALLHSKITLGNLDELKNLITNFALKANPIDELCAMLKGNLALITDGPNNAYIINDNVIKTTKPLPKPNKTANNLGAGDAAYAGFLLGLLNDYEPIIAAQIAMAFANMALKTTQARIQNPKEIFNQFNAELPSTK